MNKGIIIEVKKDYAIALNNDGIMEKILLKKDMQVGQKIFYFEEDIIKSNKSKIILLNHGSLMKRIGAIAAIFILVFTFFQSVNNEKAYAVVSLDINPSIQIEVSKDKKIIKVEGINDDGKEIDFSNVIGNDINDGIEEIKDILIEKNYLDNNKDVLIAFALVKNNDDNQYEETIKGAIQETFKTENVTYVKGNKEAVAEAKTKGISLGRYEASLKADYAIKDNIKEVPVKEITSSIKDDKNVITWEADDKKDSNVKEGNIEPIIQQPATETKDTDSQPVQKPSVIESKDSDKSNNTTTDSTKATNKSDNKVDNGIIDLEPELPQTQKEDTTPSKDNKANENSNVNNNNKGSNKENDDGIVNISPDSNNN